MCQTAAPATAEEHFKSSYFFFFALGIRGWYRQNPRGPDYFQIMPVSTQYDGLLGLGLQSC